MARHQCPQCAYIYDEQLGCPHEGYSPGTLWQDLPEDFSCPECFVREKPDFIALDNRAS